MRGATSLVIILLATWQVQSFLYVPLAPKKADYERKVPKKIGKHLSDFYNSVYLNSNFISKDGRAIARPLSVFNYGLHERFRFLKEAIAKANLTTPKVCIYKKAVPGWYEVNHCHCPLNTQLIFYIPDVDLKMKVLTFAKVKFQKKLTNRNVNPSKILDEPKSTASGVSTATTDDPIKYTNPENSSTSPYQNPDRIQITLTSPSMPPTETTTSVTSTPTTTTQKTTPTPSTVMSTSTTQKYYTRIFIIRR